MTSFIEDYWSYMYYDIFGGNDWAMYTVGTSIFITVVFWGLSGMFMVVDLTGWPKWMLRYKMTPGVNQPVDPEKLKQAVKVVFVNHFVVMLPMMAAVYPFAQWMGSSAKPEDLPTVWRIMKDFSVGLVLNEVYFYYSHRLMHWTPLYKRFHKMHHSWIAPIGVASFYAHPVENIIVNVPTLICGTTMMGSHVFAMWLWYVLGMMQTIIGHSDYHLPFSTSPEYHLYHHHKFHYNFGSELGILDKFHGTHGGYKQSLYYKRHIVMMNTTPIRERYPDEKKER